VCHWSRSGKYAFNLGPALLRNFVEALDLSTTSLSEIRPATATASDDGS
jgi:hypothetical protein